MTTTAARQPYRTPEKALSSPLKKQPVNKNDYEAFKERFNQYLLSLGKAEEERQSEAGSFRNHLQDFLKYGLNYGNHPIAPKSFERNIEIDLAIHHKEKPQPVGALFELKRPGSTEMIEEGALNRKALHEAALYYLWESDENSNDEIQHIVISDFYRWWIFDASAFYKLFHQTKFLNKFRKWRKGQLDSTGTEKMYEIIGRELQEEDLGKALQPVFIDLNQYKPYINSGSEGEKELTTLYKILSPEHLLNEYVANDSNVLNKGFYGELLHILGLEETGDKTKYIERASARHSGSLIEGAIAQLDTGGKIDRLDESEKEYYGTDRQEQLFNVALELCITWMNRVLFLKLLEAQLINFHEGNRNFAFLTSNNIQYFDDLYELFFRVLALKWDDRTSEHQEKFPEVPYLNSSLFEPTDLEKQTIAISDLHPRASMPLYEKSVLKTGTRSQETEKNTLEYLLQFLDAYDFGTTEHKHVKDDRKDLISASVLGLVFEKINGYKEGSYFTPGFVTMYMARETLRRRVVDAFNEQFGWKCEDFDHLKENISRTDKRLQELNDVIDNLKICDPAVGSGHFLVSVLNELVALKSELNILLDADEGQLIHNRNDYTVKVGNDELEVEDAKGNRFTYTVHLEENPRRRQVNKNTQRIQKALFNEKRKLIENCLFGVDINTNSVKICRLRLWIELLKNAYYREEEEYQYLETLPNIDINIKQGNSLIQKFENNLTALDRETIKSKIKEYKWLADQYKEETNPDSKQKISRQIEGLKEELEKYAVPNDPDLQKLRKKEREMEGLIGVSERFKDQVSKVSEEFTKLDEKFREKMKTVYSQAFEWSLEFPEVLNEEGQFTGFDVVIGNPPYIDIKGLNQTMTKYLFDSYETSSNRVNIYAAFVELGRNILKNDGKFGFIIPNSLLMNSSYQKLRDLLHDETFEIVKLPDNTFKDAIVETILLFFAKGKNYSYVDVIHYHREDQIEKISNDQAFSVNKETWEQFDKIKFNIYLDEEKGKVIQKCLKDSIRLIDIAETSLGITPYDKYKGHSKETIENKAYHSTQKEDENYKPLIKGENIKPFYVDETIKEYICYGDWLGAPREERFFTEPRVIMRQIVSKDSPRLYAAYSESPLYFTQIGFGIIPKEKIGAKALSVILSSKLLAFYHKYLCLDIEKDVFQKILIENCKNFPIKLPSSEVEEELAEKNDKIQEHKEKGNQEEIEKIAQQLDLMVYKLYGLTYDEVKVVDPEIEVSEGEYGEFFKKVIKQ